MRVQYISSIPAQDSTYFDKNGCGEITTRADKDIDTINIGYGEKLGWVIWLVCYVISVSNNVWTRILWVPKADHSPAFTGLNRTSLWPSFRFPSSPPYCSPSPSG